MSTFKLLGAVAILFDRDRNAGSRTAGDLRARLLRFFYPYANCQNKGPGNPYTDPNYRGTSSLQNGSSAKPDRRVAGTRSDRSVARKRSAHAANARAVRLAAAFRRAITSRPVDAEFLRPDGLALPRAIGSGLGPVPAQRRHAPPPRRRLRTIEEHAPALFGGTRLQTIQRVPHRTVIHFGDDNRQPGQGMVTPGPQRHDAVIARFRHQREQPHRLVRDRTASPVLRRSAGSISR